jgi:hypothetical protein
MRRVATGSCVASTEARALAVALALTLGFAPGCNDRREADDARGILSAYEAFQNAVPSDRRAALAALASAKCRDATVCADRDACATYATALVRASELTAKARSLAPEDAGGNGAATMKELGIIVAGAEEAIGEAEQAEKACTAALERLSERRAKSR